MIHCEPPIRLGNLVVKLNCTCPSQKVATIVVLYNTWSPSPPMLRAKLDDNDNRGGQMVCVTECRMWNWVGKDGGINYIKGVEMC